MYSQWQMPTNTIEEQQEQQTVQRDEDGDVIMQDAPECSAQPSIDTSEDNDKPLLDQWCPIGMRR